MMSLNIDEPSKGAWEGRRHGRVLL